MIIRREVCFLILAVALGSVSGFHCPTNCTCQEGSREGSRDFIDPIKINCLVKNDSSFLVEIDRLFGAIHIRCINLPDWSDFHLNLTDSKLSIDTLRIEECDLRSNNNLGEITRKIWVRYAEESHMSTEDLISVVKKQNLDDFTKSFFEDLLYLTLLSNNMSYVDNHLKALSLTNTNLHLVTGFFNYTSRLDMLDLTNNGLRSIELGTFDDLKNLTRLYLSKNHLTELQSGIFDELIAVNSLYLDENDMVKLPEDIFAKLKNLNYIVLSKNNFTDLPRNLLQNNAKLISVRMNANKRNMTTLPKKFFANLRKLNILDLKANGFVTLPKDLLWGCTSLTKINLEQNYLQTLPDHIFSKKYKLVKLNLSKNRITSVSEQLFSDLISLKELNMEDNGLMSINLHSLNNLSKLKIAKFSKNYLTLVEGFMQYLNRKISPFRHCTSLEELYLANNNISEIFIDWNLILLQLRKLDLKYNNISYVTNEDVLFRSNIQVDLTHNRIENIFLHGIERFIHPEDAHAKILVDNNPLHCDCQLYDFLRFIEGRMHPRIRNYLHIRLENLTCQSPKELKNVRIMHLKSESLTCVANYTACPEVCNCLKRPEDNAFIFNCSQRNLTSVPNDIKTNDSFRFELNFSGNQLTRMPNLKAMKLESVKNLTLSHNSITEISLDGLPSTIQVLELHNNNVSRIHPDVLEFLKNSTNLTRLTLHENPWECDCDAKEFQNFIRNSARNDMIPDIINVKCVGSNISVLETNDFCVVNTTIIMDVSITISLMGFFICFFGLLYYKYQRQIKVWLFAHQWCLWFVTEEELDKEKLYDAFVSYSHKDHDFVENELVSKLENGSTPFKLCLHYRDWLAGEWIPANIASSVENSRRTIVVLSPNFLQSVWGKMEFRTAHHQALSEGRARVILILYDDIGPIDNLDPELKAYISTNTYIKWGDPWFWDKLKYALPHQSSLARYSETGNKIFEHHQMCIQANGEKKERVYQFPLARCSESEI